MRLLAAAFSLLLTTPTMTADWTTDAERSGYERSPNYADTIAWLERLDRAAPQLALLSFGRTPEGRDMKLVVAASDGEFTPAKARAAGKAVVLVEGGIHSGEIEGKDAGLALLRDLTVGQKHPDLLDHVVLLVIPVFNADGHERASRWNRINQSGPTEKGTRGTAQNINLNRDFVKADAPEMRAWLALFDAWRPDLFIDIHSTNGADYQYDLTWFLEEWDNLHAAPRAWQQDALVGRVFPATERRGHLLAPYLELVDHRDIVKGLSNFGSGPRFSTGYVAIRNRPAILVETHMLKSYESRVKATSDLLVEVLAEVNARPEALRSAVARADRETIARIDDTTARVPLVFSTAAKPEEFQLKGYAYTQTASEISGDVWTQYDRKQPKVFEIPFWRQLEATVSVAPPAAYAIPPAWAADLVERLDAHGISHFASDAERSVTATRYRLREPTWAARPFEGRIRIDKVEVEPRSETMKLAAGTVIVPLDQAGANVAIHLLEPQAPDSLLAWGHFNIIFEAREYADARVAEGLAREMLRDDPALREDFDQRLREPKFAQDPQARLAFFFERSKWAEPELGMYPVVRLDAAALRAIRARGKP